MALVLSVSLAACGKSDKWPEEEAAEEEDSAEEETEVEEEPSQEPEQEEPKKEEPEESAEPTQEPKEESNAGTEFLALLQEEWNNGFVEGKGPRHTYFDMPSSGERQAFIDKGVVYIYGVKGHGDNFYSFCSYDIASKELHESVSPDISGSGNFSLYFMDGNFYFMGLVFRDSQDSVKSRMYDSNGAVLATADLGDLPYCFFEKGILAQSERDGTIFFLPHNLEEVTEIPDPQREVEHGLKEDVDIGNMFAADGTVYGRDYESHLYRFNADTYEWEDTGNVSDFTNQVGSFCGKYVTRNDGIYDRLTGEQIFEYGDLYPAVSEWGHDNLCYFGGDKYLGVKDNEYRWVNLKDLSMSDPLPFPEDTYSLNVLNDTYCVYSDKYGYFLWNYNTGEEETIVMFEQ